MAAVQDGKRKLERWAVLEPTAMLRRVGVRAKPLEIVGGLVGAGRGRCFMM